MRGAPVGGAAGGAARQDMAGQPSAASWLLPVGGVWKRPLAPGCDGFG